MSSNFQILKLKTESPVSIGTGIELSPMHDYYRDERKNIRYIDHNRFDDWLIKSQHRVDRFMNQTIEYQNLNKSDFFETFCTSEGEDRSDFAMPYEVPCYADTNPVSLKTTIKQADMLPYIPGSSLKGAIKGSLFFNWLADDSRGKQIIQEITTSLNTSSIKKWEVQKELDTLLKAKDRWGRYEFSSLSIRDSRPFEAHQWAVLLAERIRLIESRDEKGSSGSIPQYMEAIPPGLETAVALKLDKFAHPYLTFLNQANGLEQLFKKINYSSSLLIEHEIDMIERRYDRAKPADKEGFEGLLDFYTDLLLAVRRSGNRAYLALGFGKTYYHQAIGYHVSKVDYGAFKSLLELTNYTRVNKDNFPITRLTSQIKGQHYPLGWISLTGAFARQQAQSTVIQIDQLVKNDWIEAKCIALSEGSAKVGINVEGETVECIMTNQRGALKQNIAEGDLLIVEITGLSGEKVTQCKYIKPA